jgi:hypothetical protein
MISIVSKTVLYLWSLSFQKRRRVPVILVVYPVEGIEISLIVFYVFWKGVDIVLYSFLYNQKKFVGLDYCKPDFARLFQ